MTVGQRIHEVARKKRISQKELAEAIGISPSSVSDWKKGSVPSSDNLKKAAEFLGVSVDFLLTGSESAAVNNINSGNNVVQGMHVFIKNGAAEERELSDQEVELLRIFHSLDVKRQTSLLSYAYKLEDESKNE